MRYVHQHADFISSADGQQYIAQVFAAERPDHMWDAWCVFFPAKGDAFVAGDRETTQSTFDSVRYWASGLTHRYFEGALERARRAAERPLARHDQDEASRAAQRAAEAHAYAEAAGDARERAHELELMRRAMRRGIRFG